MNISSVTSAAGMIQPQQVSASARRAADNDGDGRTGAAALNDGDAAARKAAGQAGGSGHTVDIKA